MKNNKLMKSILITSFVSTSVLLANNIEIINIKESIHAYNNNNFKKAYDGLNKYLENNPGNKRINFMLGRSAFELGLYEDALSFYERVILEEPENLRTRLEMAQCYFKLEKYEEAKEQYNIVLKEDIPPAVRKNVMTSLQTLEASSKKHIFRTTLMAGLVYDSNINNDAESGSYTIAGIPNSTTEEDDISLQLALSLNHKYKLTNSTGLESSGTVYTQRYFDNHNKDLDLISLSTAYAKYEKDLKLSIGGKYDHVRLGDDSYLNIYTITPKVTNKLSKTLSYDGKFNFIQKDYFIDEDRDSKTYEIVNSLLVATKDYGRFNTSLVLGTERRDKGIRTDVSSNYGSIKVGNIYPLSKTLVFNSSIEYKITDYKYTDAIFLTKREDKKASLNLGLIKAFDKNLSVSFNTNLTDQKSNHGPYDYDKYSFRTNLIYNF